MKLLLFHRLGQSKSKKEKKQPLHAVSKPSVDFVIPQKIQEIKPFKAKNFLHSVGFALQGIRFVFQTERNFRTHVALAGLCTGLGLLLHLASWEWVGLIVVMGMVLLAEVMNSALEYTLDLLTQNEFDMRAKHAKDMAAGACLLVAGCAAIVGCLIFIPHILSYF